MDHFWSFHLNSGAVTEFLVVYNVLGNNFLVKIVDKKLNPGGPEDGKFFSFNLKLIKLKSRLPFWN